MLLAGLFHTYIVLHSVSKLIVLPDAITATFTVKPVLLLRISVFLHHNNNYYKRTFILY